MSEEYIKEYEEMSLCDFADELVEPLNTVKQDLTKIIYIHYAKERDKNEQLQQENLQLKERIEKTIEYITIYRSYENIDGKDYLKGKDEIGELNLLQVDKLLETLKGDE